MSLDLDARMVRKPQRPLPIFRSYGGKEAGEPPMGEADGDFYHVT